MKSQEPPPRKTSKSEPAAPLAVPVSPPVVKPAETSPVEMRPVEMRPEWNGMVFIEQGSLNFTFFWGGGEKPPETSCQTFSDHQGSST